MAEAITIPEYFQMAADKTGFVREKYVEADMPTTLSNVTVIPFFGDYRSQFVLTTLILHRYLAAQKAGRYVIVCSYPGLAGLFPYADEYWSVGDASLAAELQSRAAGFDTSSDRGLMLRRSLREYFRDIVTWHTDMSSYYECGLTKNFFDVFKQVQVALPQLRSLRMDLNRQIAGSGGYKVFVHPAKNATIWQNSYRLLRTDREFWKDLYERLLKEGITPVVWQTSVCHDLSADFAGRCVFFNETNVLDVLAAMRACHCVLDVHSGISRYAGIARCPFLCVEDRHKFNSLKDYELDDLCLLNKTNQYIFSFATILDSQNWSSLVDSISVKLSKMLPGINRDEWPTTSEHFSTVSYSAVRKLKSKRIGSRFVKVPKM